MSNAGLHVVVVGLANSGRAAAELAVKSGYRVTGLDTRTDIEPIDGVTLELGPHSKETLLGADKIILSPGVPPNQPDIVAARDAGVELVGELGFAWSHLSLPAIAVTGTNGKSTVTHFVGQLLQMAGRTPFVGGNLGTPLSLAVGGAYDIAVVEVSSYQLEYPGEFAPTVAAVLNLSPDHLARHGTMENYAAAKCEIFRRIPSSGLAFWPATDPLLNTTARGIYSGPHLWLGARPGVTRAKHKVLVDMGMQSWHFDLSEFSIPGEHNLDNAATAIALCLSVGVRANQLQRSIAKLEGLPHRMEVVCTTDDIQWINDSKATNVEAATVGLRGIARKAVVLLGGQAKGPGFDALEPALKEHKAVIAFGGSGQDIADELGVLGMECQVTQTMEEAIALARTLVSPGEAVLLSPGCASFDAYRNFEHRGDVFRQCVLEGAP